MSRRRRQPPNRPADPLGALYPTLDLHGLTADQATSSARLWIDQNRADGELVVRIVTGRGLHSAGPPVLPATIEELLARMKGGAVRDYETEPGGGVFRVRLTPAPPRLSSPSSPHRHPARLIREAEEALAELGITPTPSLLEAEIRRIIKEHPDKAE